MIHLYIQIGFASLVGSLIVILILVKGWAGLLLAFCPAKLVACKKRCAKKRLKQIRDEFEDDDLDFKNEIVNNDTHI